MNQKASEEKLSELHGVLAKELTKRISVGETRIELIDCDGHVQEHTVVFPAGAPTLSVARQFLKDNHIEAGLENEDLQDLVDSLPFDDGKDITSGPVN